MKDANKFMKDIVRQLARAQPSLCDKSGRGFWPVPALFPHILARLMYQLQEEATQAYIHNNTQKGAYIAEMRSYLSTLTHEGDLGENHTQLFIDDHPLIGGLTQDIHTQLPFYQFCKEISSQGVYVTLGAVVRNEQGSVGEAEALVETKIITEGSFSKVHLFEEPEHARHASSIEKIAKAQDFSREAFMEGMRLHDNLYRTIGGC